MDRRLKILILVVATNFAAWDSQAQVGYTRIAFPAGFSMLSNPLYTTNNTLNGLIAGVPDRRQA